MPKYFNAGTIPFGGNMYFLYGGKGTKKTRAIKLFSGNKLVLSFDGSYSALADTDNVKLIAYGEADAPQIQAQVRYDLTRFLYDFNKDTKQINLDENGRKKIASDVDMIVLDNVSALQNWVIDNIENASKDGRQNWNLVQKWFRDLGAELRELGIPVLATAHQVDGANPNTFKPDMNDKTRNAFAGWFDILGRIHKENGEFMVDVDPEKGNEGANRLDTRTNFKLENLLQDETQTTTNTETKEEGN
ncbi:ATP-binding protein [Weissella ceti]|uniref:ATP-binding protein n=1 Tax=Weissella ceti TaxID=759620 RepID=A0ABT3E4D6_9LACO|nr:AAA family ATPase [Weissella ceti]MCW0953269.1 ATP-binding protein [Weissella ceti]QVK11379.1 AAA family ATPase [Weissella ceti]